MRALILVLIFTLGIHGWSPPTGAQTVDEINGVASSFENAASHLRGLAQSTLKAARAILSNDILMAIVSDEAALIRQTSTASARAERRLAHALEMVSAKLRREAARRQPNRN